MVGIRRQLAGILEVNPQAKVPGDYAVTFKIKFAK